MSTEDQFTCRYCKELVKKGAIRCPHCHADIRSDFRKHPIKYFVAGLFGICVLVMIISITSTMNNPVVTEATKPKPAIVKSSDPIERIEQNVKEIGDYDVTVADSKNKDLANSNTKPPYNVIVIYSNPKDCLDSKIALTNTMKAIYSDPVLEGKIARVKFFATGIIEASLGYNDAKGVVWTNIGLEKGASIGPSIFWNTFQKYKVNGPSEKGDFKNMTWGINIQECN